MPAITQPPISLLWLATDEVFRKLWERDDIDKLLLLARTYMMNWAHTESDADGFSDRLVTIEDFICIAMKIGYRIGEAKKAGMTLEDFITSIEVELEKIRSETSVREI